MGVVLVRAQHLPSLPSFDGLIADASLSFYPYFMDVALVLDQKAFQKQLVQALTTLPPALHAAIKCPTIPGAHQDSCT